MQGDLAKCLHFYHWNNETIRTFGFFSFSFLCLFHRRILRFKKQQQDRRGSRREVWDSFTGIVLFPPLRKWYFKQQWRCDSSLESDKEAVLATWWSGRGLRGESGETWCSNSLLFLRWSLWRVFLRVRVLCSVCFLYEKKEKREDCALSFWWLVEVGGTRGWAEGSLLCFSKKKGKKKKRNCRCFK